MCTAEREVEVSGEVDRDEKSDQNERVSTLTQTTTSEPRLPPETLRPTTDVLQCHPEILSSLPNHGLGAPEILMCVGLSRRGFRT